MTFDVDAAAARHRPFLPEKDGRCDYCRQEWPCDAAQAVDVIREIGDVLQAAEAEVERLRENLDATRIELARYKDRESTATAREALGSVGYEGDCV